MGVRSRWSNFARRATPFFSALGILALLFLIVAGILSHAEMFADTTRYGVRFYGMVFLLTLAGMVVGAVVPRLLAVDNYQTRAISLETGLRNASLAMAMALLIQDFMGDFHSSMFFTSAMFGLLMYVAGFISIWIYPKLLPLPVKP
jgi:predicted Na+-dependent transporter